MRFDIITLTAGCAATASAFECSGHYFSFFNRPGPAMSYQRLDPGLFPGSESPHLHSFDGGNGLAQSMGFENTQDSSCTTARVKSDKSLYWRPTLFFNNGSSYHRVPEKATKIYYRYGDGDNWANVTGYPEGFNMIAGSPNRRSDDGDNPAGVRWGCHEPDGGSTAIFDNGFPKGFSSCNYGFASEVTFPSCWNGEKMNPEDGNAHMAYPNSYSGVGIENCPSTHRAARFPTLFIEYWWDVSGFTFGPDEAPWVLSNGDPTGYGFHADFMNGWESGVLDKAVSEHEGCTCGCGCGQEEMEQCFGSANVNNDDDKSWASCSADSGARSSEDATVMEVLPGCNPLQYGPEAATTATGPGCTATAGPVAGSSSKVSSAVASKTPAADVSSAIYSEATPDASATTPAAYPAITPGASSIMSEAGTVAKPAPLNAYPVFSAAFPNKQVQEPTGDYNAAQPTPTASSQYDVPAGNTPTSASSSAAVPADQTVTPVAGGDDDEECKPPVYVTVTPTVYVTADVADVADATTCAAEQTVYQTMTETVTVAASASKETGSY
ncbi:wsc domain-containing protein [Stemphylium lycopersici]|nr:wsc domain-containing protein [Stemphylium lycopersici]